MPAVGALMGGSHDDNGSPDGKAGTSRKRPTIKGVTTMRIKLSYIAPMLATGAAAVAIAAAPIAAADTGQSCGGNVCQSPGNVQINDSPPPVSFYPYGGDAFLLGGGGFGGHGGGHR
jgi:hypothetical protein